MKKVWLSLALLPVVAAAQSSSAVTSRVAALLGSGVAGGTQGLYLKQAGGSVLANQQENFAFDPGTAADLVTLLLAMQQADSRALTLNTAVTHYDNIAAGCPNPLFPNGTEALSVALRELMWRSDNARAVALRNFFGLQRLNDLAASIGMKKTSLPATPGCANSTGTFTLTDAAALLEAVENGTLVASPAAFNGYLAGKAQATLEGTDTSRIWSVDLPAIVRQEAPAGTTTAQQSAYVSQMDLGYKTGVVTACQNAGCSSVLETLSLSGWARIPYCSGAGFASHDFVFGEFIANAPDSAYFLGKTTAAQSAFASARAELLREQIRSGLATCYAASPALVNPPPGSTLPGRTVTFNWSSGTGWNSYRLDIGARAGGADYASVTTAVPQALVTNLPCDGRALFVRLSATAATYQTSTDYQYKACTNGGPQITSPPPGASLFASSLSFSWTGVNGADSYRLDLGTTPAGTDIASITTQGTTAAVSGLPTDGRVIYARIVAHTATGFGTPNDYAYNNLYAITPVVSSVVNAVSPGATISAGTLVVITGVNFGDNPTVAFGATRATVVGTSTATQLTAVVPPALGVGIASVSVTAGGLTGPPFTVPLSAASPALYSKLLDTAGAPLTRALQPGDAAAVQGTGFGPFSNGVPALGLAVKIGDAGVSATITSITALPSTPGIYQINFLVPIGTPSGSQPLVVTVGSARSNALAITIAGPAVKAVLNAASFATGAKVAPGSLVSVFGDSLAPSDALGVFPLAALPGGGAITINGVSAPLFDVVASQGQINLLIPFETPSSGSVPVVVTNAAGTSAAFSLAMAPAAPGIFRLPDPSNAKRSNGAVLLANTAWRVMPLSMAAALGIPQDCAANSVPIASICGQPAAPGDAIQIYATGLGRATPNGNPVGNMLRTGDVAPANGRTLYMTVETPKVTIGGVDAQVVFSGIAPGFAGLYQINAVIPGGVPAGDDVPVVVTVGGASDQATIAIRAK